MRGWCAREPGPEILLLCMDGGLMVYILTCTRLTTPLELPGVPRRCSCILWWLLVCLLVGVSRGLLPTQPPS